MRIRLTIAVLVALVALGAAACSGATSGTSAGDGTSGSIDTLGGPAATTDYSKYLTPADVEEVSGLTGLKAVAQGSSGGAQGQVNIASADGDLVLTAFFGDGAMYDSNFKSEVNFGEPIDGLGDAAFVGPPGDVSYVIGFKKGDKSAMLLSLFKPGSGGTVPVLSIEQLTRLADIVVSRF